ncbi:Pr6Pr family membrane protein [Luteibacter yeojuensis]|uniref:Pr6Pr family membrane protein n=1 Tax=Luteibacter yeojuensis TaxID=345309 RepID=A0A7X5TMZ4_9GAMM|nr:Pr6Pr family membrane protein [Luteibacter yeojuensis]NID14236.1 Pr6Pr family membrane protein [Luteibacter yeojuensis]
MSNRTTAVSNLFAIVVAAVAWPTLVLQYWLIVWSGSLGAVTIRYFSFFTILSNLLVALVAASAATGGNWAPMRLLRAPRVRGLAAVSIAVTGLVYLVVLRSLWHPLGPQLIADRSLHYVIPMLYLAWWLALLPHGGLVWHDALRWLWFPFLFALWTFVRGAIVDEYPYPFLDVGQLGYPAALLNATLVAVLFLVLGVALVTLDKALGKRSTDG